jgi:hypothetical protein
MRTCSLVLVAMLAVVAQPVAALNMQLQLQLTKGVARTRQNDAYLSIAASSFLAIKVSKLDFSSKRMSQCDMIFAFQRTSQLITLNNSNQPINKPFTPSLSALKTKTYLGL